ncbi:16S rRNA (guanine(966)-N(2))-methyltransferase RsmD [Xylanibacillus composti]|uniref:Methyltransferase n=1 Tax=Xylanibacillus composti TaxID=1572762 RepID=A0A8J4M294_9BACL|nr:16S rRNA (guanine(966)-N(2))-methyltransferase RsmD [Xylanibacillus composti]MDT9724142.1 16S rRNA (guanine(966)-N(2))-methyltransferase RsmD [Xylanibacillus composti]GIQ68692.1 methyltransferase [Xylanibacillus composti]
MRIIAGSAKGRPLKAVPGSGTRPTTDKVKEALFSIIGPYFEGGRVLDLFAGTGGLGLEALSRGMDEAVFVDADHRSVSVIKENARHAGFAEQCEIYRNEASRAIRALAKRERQFDLIFLDPPYKMKDMHDWLTRMLELGLLAKGATAVIEHDAQTVYPEQLEDLHCIRQAIYGDIAITIYNMQGDGVQ